MLNYSFRIGKGVNWQAIKSSWHDFLVACFWSIPKQSWSISAIFWFQIPLQVATWWGWSCNIVGSKRPNAKIARETRDKLVSLPLSSMHAKRSERKPKQREKTLSRDRDSKIRNDRTKDKKWDTSFTKRDQV